MEGKQRKKRKGLQASDNNIEHGGERFPSIRDVLVNNNASEPNKQCP
jgi:hypothetical protein